MVRSGKHRRNTERQKEHGRYSEKTEYVDVSVSFPDTLFVDPQPFNQSANVAKKKTMAAKEKNEEMKQSRARKSCKHWVPNSVRTPLSNSLSSNFSFVWPTRARWRPLHGARRNQRRLVGDMGACEIRRVKLFTFKVTGRRKTSS